jgi:hypothetical protein
MILIQYGEIGPRAVLLQTLLRAKGATLDIDGVFGGQTYRAVIAFQKGVPGGALQPDGVVGPKTWPYLVDGADLTVADSVDVTDLPYIDKKTGLPRVQESEDEGDAKELEAGGGHPIRQRRVPGHGVEDAVQKIINYVGNDQEIALLRFHGHGNHGTWFTIEAGDPVDLSEKSPEAYKALAADENGYLTEKNFHIHKLTLARLTPYFAPYGSAEHHGCRVGRNSRGVLRLLADLWGVPVTAGNPDQYGGGGGSTYVFEGATFTAYPDGGSLKTWAAKFAD